MSHFLTIFGTPSDRGKWGWRVEGHNLSLNFLLEDGKIIAATPTFFGANHIHSIWRNMLGDFGIPPGGEMTSSPSALCHLPSALCPLPSALCPLPFALRPLPSALCHLPSGIPLMPPSPVPAVGSLRSVHSLFTNTG